MIDMTRTPTPHAHITLVRLIGYVLCVVVVSNFCAACHAQLQVLSKGNVLEQWQKAQLQALDTQIADTNLPQGLRPDLEAQKRWLAGWKSSSIPASSDETQAGTESKAGSNAGVNADAQRLKEPIIDPTGRARPHRARLFGSTTPSTRDTTAFQSELTQRPDDPGLRQLQLHWIDQTRYRDEYWSEIAAAADRFLLLVKGQTSRDAATAAAFANYRKARALAHGLRGKPLSRESISGIDDLDDEDRDELENKIVECHKNVNTLVGERPEFFQLSLYVYNKKSQFGHALEVLEKNKNNVDADAYQAEISSVLNRLGWNKIAEKMSSKSDAKQTRALELQYTRR